MNRKRVVWIAVWAVLVVVIGIFAFGYGPGGTGYAPWQGWGRMGGWDGGYRADSALRGYGMGPGMMAEPGDGWGAGRSYGMMGPYGGGMPGAGPGPGLGMGMGMGGYAMMPWGLPDLTAEQAQKIGKLQSESEARNRDLAQRIWEAQARLGGLYTADKRDWKAIRAASQSLFDLQRRKLETAIDMQQEIDALLTDGQRREMARWWRGYGQR